MTSWLLTLSLVLSASLAHATVVTWQFDQVGDLGIAPLVLLGDDGISTVTLTGLTSLVPNAIVGKQDNPIDHGYGVGLGQQREIDEGDLLVATFSSNVFGPITAWLESLEGPLFNPEKKKQKGSAWEITDSAATILANGFGGDTVQSTVALPSDRTLMFTVPAGRAPNDFLVASLAAYTDTTTQVPMPATGLLILVGATLLGAATATVRAAGRIFEQEARRE